MKRMTPMLIDVGAGAVDRRRRLRAAARSASADSSLARDLSLAAHQRDSLDSVSAVESQRVASRPRARLPVDDDPRP